MKAPSVDDFTACVRSAHIAMVIGSQLSDATARTIASLYADDKAGYALATTGAILDGVWFSLFGSLYSNMPPEEQRMADMMETYIVNREAEDQTGPVPGWSNLWVR